MALMELRAGNLAGVTGFQWDTGNDSKTWTRHAVAREECEQLFFNQPFLIADDIKHSGKETRCFALGHTNDDRLLMVVFTIRRSLIRVISARPMSRTERRIYAEKSEDDVEGA